jgi:hypothetical protein
MRTMRTIVQAGYFIARQCITVNFGGLCFMIETSTQVLIWYKWSLGLLDVGLITISNHRYPA